MLLANLQMGSLTFSLSCGGWLGPIHITSVIVSFTTIPIDFKNSTCFLIVISVFVITIKSPFFIRCITGLFWLGFDALGRFFPTWSQQSMTGIEPLEVQSLRLNSQPSTVPLGYSNPLPLHLAWFIKVQITIQLKLKSSNG